MLQLLGAWCSYKSQCWQVRLGLVPQLQTQDRKPRTQHPTTHSLHLRDSISAVQNAAGWALDSELRTFGVWGGVVEGAGMDSLGNLVSYVMRLHVSTGARRKSRSDATKPFQLFVPVLSAASSSEASDCNLRPLSFKFQICQSAGISCCLEVVPTCIRAPQVRQALPRLLCYRKIEFRQSFAVKVVGHPSPKNLLEIRFKALL